MSRSTASILHADLDSFYASVEQRDDPALRGRPVAVGGGVVLAASYEAKARGVTSAMGLGRARTLCPELVVVPARFRAYAEASAAVFGIFADTAPTVERMSIDEAFLDVSGLERIAGTPAAIAARLRARVRAEAGLAITVGVARTKFLAKVASGVAKPDGLLVVAVESEQAFLRPLPVRRLWGVGEKTAAALRTLGLETVADVADVEPGVLEGVLGRGRGRHLLALAHNEDPRPVQAGTRRRSVGAQRALGRQPRPFAEIQVALSALVDRVSRRLRSAGRLCRTVVLRLRFGDYERATRSRTLPRATTATAVLAATAAELLDGQREAIADRGLTLVGVALTNLSDASADGVQLELGRPGGAELDATLDRVKDRFGTTAITRGSLVGQRRQDLLEEFDA